MFALVSGTLVALSCFPSVDIPSTQPLEGEWDWRKALQVEAEQTGCLPVACVACLWAGLWLAPHGKSPFTSLDLNGSVPHLPTLFSCDLGLRVLDFVLSRLL